MYTTNEFLGFSRKTRVTEQGGNDAHVLITILAARVRLGSTGYDRHTRLLLN